MTDRWTRVRVGDHSFGVLDRGEIPIETADYSNGLVVTMAAGATIYTGIDTGTVRVRAVAQTAPPAQDEPDTPPWEEIVEASLYAPYGQLRIDSPDQGPVPDLPLLSPAGPGWYRIRAHARGRDTAFDAVRTEPVEDYLLYVWPADPAPPTVINATDRCGQGLRAAAATQGSTTASPSEAPDRAHQDQLRDSLLRRTDKQPPV